MLVEQKPEAKFLFRNPFLCSLLVLLAAVLSAGWIVPSRWEGNRQTERSGAEKEREADRRAPWLIRGHELDIRSFYASLATIHGGETIQSVLLALFPKTDGLQTDRPTNPQKLVPPSAYHIVPASIRTELQRHGCSLPETQAMDNGAEPINVVSGHFSGKVKLDWAAVCVIHDRPQVFLVWGSRPPACSSEIHSGWPLKEKFSEEPEGGIFLHKITSQRILNYRRAFPEGQKPTVTHDGLEVGNEQASLIYYCNSGKWLELRGND